MAFFLIITVVPVAWPLFALNFLRGFGDAAVWPTGRSYFSRLVPVGRMAAAMAIMQMTTGLARSAGALLAGQMADSWGYLSVFYLAAFLSCSGLGVITKWSRSGQIAHRPRTVYDLPSRASTSGNVHPPRSAVSTWRRLVLLYGITILSSVRWGALAFLPLFVVSALGKATADVGWLFTVSGITSLSLVFILGRVGDRIGWNKIVGAGLLIDAISVSGIGLAQEYHQVMMLVLMGAIGSTASKPALNALVWAAAHDGELGRVMGLYGMCENSGMVLGPALGSLTWRLYGEQGTFLFCGGMMLLGAVLAMVGLSAQWSKPVAEM
jgi:DHA1 family multidrug resistance protein-like MFS transporter